LTVRSFMKAHQSGRRSLRSPRNAPCYAFPASLTCSFRRCARPGDACNRRRGQEEEEVQEAKTQVREALRGGSDRSCELRDLWPRVSCWYLLLRRDLRRAVSGRAEIVRRHVHSFGRLLHELGVHGRRSVHRGGLPEWRMQCPEQTGRRAVYCSRRWNRRLPRRHMHTMSGTEVNLLEQ
jgi:hypothetical protein